MEKIFAGFVRIVVCVLLAMMAIVALLSVADLAWLLIRELVVGPIVMPAVPQLFEIFGLATLVAALSGGYFLIRRERNTNGDRG